MSQFVYDNDKSQPGRRKPVKSTYVTFDSAMEKEEEHIDVDDVMQSIEIDLKRKSSNSDSLSFDDAGVWDEVIFKNIKNICKCICVKKKFIFI